MLSFKICFLYRSHLNDGAHGISNVLEQFSIDYGIYTNIQAKRTRSVLVLNLVKQGKKRKRSCGIKKGVTDKNNEQKKTYIPGGF